MRPFRRTTVVGLGAIGCLLIVGVAVGYIPAETWSEWLFGNRFSFCGAEFDGSAVVFVVDSSGSSGSAFGIARKEIDELLRRSALHFEFGVVFSDRGLARFPTSSGTVRATRKNKAELREFVSAVQLGGASCIKAGLLEALRMLSESTAGKKLLLYVGDGGGTCSGEDEVVYLRETLSEVAQANDEGVIIHCIDGAWGPTGSSFLRDLSETSGGRVIALPRS